MVVVENWAAGPATNANSATATNAETRRVCMVERTCRAGDAKPPARSIDLRLTTTEPERQAGGKGHQADQRNRRHRACGPRKRGPAAGRLGLGASGRRGPAAHRRSHLIRVGVSRRDVAHLCRTAYWRGLSQKPNSRPAHRTALPVRDRTTTQSCRPAHCRLSSRWADAQSWRV